MNRDYELGFILNPEVSEEETRSILERIEHIVAIYGGQSVKVNQWGRRRLAYPIERHRDGYYIFIDMILTPEAVAEIERTLRVSEIVFRYMMKRRDPKAAQKEREARAAAAAVEAANQAATPAASAETEGGVEAPATPVEAEIPATSVEATSQAETPAEGQTEVTATTIAEESTMLSPEEIESAPPAIENPETIEA